LADAMRRLRKGWKDSSRDTAERGLVQSPEPPIPVGVAQIAPDLPFGAAARPPCVSPRLPPRHALGVHRRAVPKPAHHAGGAVSSRRPGRPAGVLADKVNYPPLKVTAAIDYCGFDRSGLSSWSIGGHSPLLQRSQNFLLLSAAVELVPLASGPPSPPHAARVTAAAISIPAAINFELRRIRQLPAR